MGGSIEARTPQPVEERLAGWAGTAYCLLDLAEEARELLALR